MNKKHIYILGIVTFLIIVFAFALQKNITQPDDTPEPPTQEEKTAEEIPQTQAKERPEIEVPDGWVKYWNDEWGIGFAYPGDWVLNEIPKRDPFKGKRETPPGYEGLGKIEASGDGYTVVIDRAGGGVPEKKWTNPEYYIGGYNVPKVWEFMGENEYEQILSTYPLPEPRSSVIFRIRSSNSSNKEITDKILSTVTFY